MGRTELPWLLWGRHVRPLAFGLSLSCAVLAALILSGGSVWGQVDPWSTMAATLAVLATAALWAGFWVPSGALMEHGLMLAAVSFAARGAYIGAAGGWSLSSTLTAALSWTFVVMAGGAWLLERTTGGRAGEGE
jgi:hypothetical protein